MGYQAGNLNEYSQNEATLEKKEVAQEAATEEKDNSIDQEPKKED